MFVKSSLCSADQPSCVELAIGRSDVVVKDSKTGNSLVFDFAEWTAFLGGVRNGEFDLPATVVIPHPADILAAV